MATNTAWQDKQCFSMPGSLQTYKHAQGMLDKSVKITLL